MKIIGRSPHQQSAATALRRASTKHTSNHHSMQFTTDRTRLGVRADPLFDFFDTEHLPRHKMSVFFLFFSFDVCPDGVDCVTDHTSVIPRPSFSSFFVLHPNVTSAAAEMDAFEICSCSAISGMTYNGRHACVPSSS